MRRSLFLALAVACSGSDEPTDGKTPDGTSTDTGTGVPWECQIPAGTVPDFSQILGCQEDFDVLASLPLDASIPGARSAKTVLDQLGGDALYFQNSQKFPIHWEFAFEHLNVDDGLPPVADLGSFNQTEYYSPDRRFLLGALTYYEGPAVWTYEISPYDTASAEQVTKAFRAIRDATWIGRQLYFHPSGENVEGRVVPGLPEDVPVITTDELFAGVDYQPLNLGTSLGQLAFYEVETLAEAYVNPCEIVVLDEVPNDLSITAGIITEQFQTPLAHINVLSQNRGTPNMGLKGAFTDQELRALEGKWVELVVGPFEYSLREVSAAEGAAFCEANKPEPLEVRPYDVSVTALVDCETALDTSTQTLAEAIDAAIPSLGAKATNFSALTMIGPEVPVPDNAFVVPMSWYDTFMTTNGFWTEVEALLADPTFQVDPTVRRAELEALQARMIAAPLDPAVVAAISDKVLSNMPDHPRVRFRSSTNSEDLGNFTGAGLYTSMSGNPLDPAEPVDLAMKTVWASVWNSRAYEERDWYGIDHRAVGMALLVHRSFPEEEANGVAITGNIFDTTGLEPAFYVNVQYGDYSVVLPDPNITTDQFLYYYDLPGQPIVYLGHSNLIPPDQTVLTATEIYELGTALAAIRAFFLPVYGTEGGFYAMDTEFKFEAPAGGTPTLYMKQARPYPGWNAGAAR